MAASIESGSVKVRLAKLVTKIVPPTFKRIGFSGLKRCKGGTSGKEGDAKPEFEESESYDSIGFWWSRLGIFVGLFRVGERDLDSTWSTAETTAQRPWNRPAHV